MDRQAGAAGAATGAGQRSSPSPSGTPAGASGSEREGLASLGPTRWARREQWLEHRLRGGRKQGSDGSLAANEAPEDRTGGRRSLYAARVGEERRDVSIGVGPLEASATIGPLRVVMRGYFSTYFLWSAQHLSGLAGKIEAKHQGGSRFDIAHRAYVLSAIQSAATFLEAMINELYQDAVDGHGVDGDGYIAPLSGDARRMMAELWRGTDEGSKLRPLDKYQMALVFAGNNPLPRGAQPFQAASLLVSVRNALAHYQPEDLSADSPNQMEKKLRGKFADNVLMAGSGNPWWPDLALGHGCSEWAYQSAKGFADRVVDQLGIRPNYRRHEQAGWFASTEDA